MTEPAIPALMCRMGKPPLDRNQKNLEITKISAKGFSTLVLWR